MQSNTSHVLPPRAYEIEIRVIAALIHLGDPKNLRVQEAMLQLDKDCFATVDTRILFELLFELFSKGNAFDFVEFMTIVPDAQYYLINTMSEDNYINTRYLHSDINKLIAYRSWRKQLIILVNAVNRSLEQTLPEEAIIAIREELDGEKIVIEWVMCSDPQPVEKAT